MMLVSEQIVTMDNGALLYLFRIAYTAFAVDKEAAVTLSFEMLSYFILDVWMRKALTYHYSINREWIHAGKSKEKNTGTRFALELHYRHMRNLNYKDCDK